MAEMYIVKTRITPEMAKDLLEKNKHNRTLSREKVNRMITDMKTGKWELTHQPIGIAEDGELTDGQHRMTAVAESGVTVEMFVAFNAPRSTKIDIGKPRDIRTSLYMADFIAKDSLEYNRSTYPLIKIIVCKEFGFAAQRSLSAEEIHAIYVNHRKYIDPIVQMITRYSKTGVPVSSSILAYVLLCAYAGGCTIETLQRWYKIVSTGDYLDENDMRQTKVGQCVMLFCNYAAGKRMDIGTPVERREEFIRKAMSSISHFERKDIISRLYGEYVYSDYEVKPIDFTIQHDKKEA